MITASRFHRRTYQALRRSRNDRGFTLIELMITLVILVILISIGVPSFTQFITSNRLTAQINELVADLSTARNLAASSSRTANLCIANSSTTCAGSGSDWATGRIIWVDYNSNGALDAGSEIFKYVPALDGGVTLTASGLPSSSSIAFQPYGGLTGSGSGLLTLCASGDTNGREVTLSYTGRVLAKRITNCP